MKNAALVYFVRCDLRPSGPTARGPGRGGGPRALGARAALPPRLPAAGPQPWATRGGAAGARRASCGPDAGAASTWVPRRRPGGLAGGPGGETAEAAAAGTATSADSTCRPRGSGLARAEPASPPPRGAPRPPAAGPLSRSRPPSSFPAPPRGAAAGDRAGSGRASPPRGGVTGQRGRPTAARAGTFRRTQTNAGKINKRDGKGRKRSWPGLFLSFHSIPVSTGNPFA